MIDISHWERALNGRAERILHSLNKGEYSGELKINYLINNSLYDKEVW